MSKPFDEFVKQIIEAKDIAFRKHIDANAIIINDNFLDVPKWQAYLRGACGQTYCVDCPEMICGLEAIHTKVALPDNVLFAVCKAQETYRNRIRREVRWETAREILDMLYGMGINKGILECCRIYDVNGVSLAKQICEKYGVEVEQ